MRCLTSVSICPSLILLLHLLPTHHVFLCWINAWGPLWFSKNGCFICFPGALQSPFYVPAVGRVTDVNNPPQKTPKKTWSRVFVCVCVSVNRDMPCFLTHAAPGLTVSFLFPPPLPLPPLQPSQPSRGESVPGVRRDLSAPEGVFFKRNKQHSGCWIGGNQAPPPPVVKLSELKMFLALLNFRAGGGVRGRLHDCVKTSNKNLTFTKWATVSAHSKGVFHARWNVYEL